jgi:ligand-binding sensor domain-containing protein/signal transduction histidine kinase
MIPLLVFALIVCLSATAFPAPRKSIKQYVHHIWTSENGLPQNSASDMLQTRDGYLWFATQEGLARFDGLKFTVFDRTNTKAFPESWIVRLIEDGQGGLWMRTFGTAPGVVRYLNGSFTRYDSASGLPSSRVITWEADSIGTFWIGTDRGLVRFDEGKSSTYTVKEGLPGDTVVALGLDREKNLWISCTRGFARLTNGRIERITGTPGFPDTLVAGLNGPHNVYEDDHGRVWMRTPHGVASYSNGSFTQYTARDGLTNVVVKDIHEDARGNLWFATAGGLHRFQDGRFTAYRISKDADENNIIQICEDRDGNLWLGTFKGIARYADGSFEQFQKKDGLSDDFVQRLLKDSEGSIWVSTFGGGLDRFRDEKFVTYSSRVGLSYDNVQTVMEDRTGALWVGTSYGGVNRLKDGVITVFDSRNGLPGNDVGSLAEDAQGNIWIGTTRGLCSYRNGSFTLRLKASGDRLANVGSVGQALLQRRSGEFLVASDNEVSVLRNGKFVHLFSIGEGPTRQTLIRTLFEDSKRTLWIATGSYLFWYRDGKLIEVTHEMGFRGEWAQAIYEDQEGDIWLGVSNVGLMRYRDGKFTPISPEQGLFDYNAYTVFEDQAGYLWSSSNKGVYRVSKKSLNDVADGKASSVTCVVYGTADGMESREGNGGYAPSGWKTHDGKLCFATTKGVVVVDPADIRTNMNPPPVVIEQFSVEGAKEDTKTTVHVPPGKQRLEFHYAGMSFAGAEQVRYKYQLVGLDKDWIDAGPRREAYYTHLDPGSYTFKIIAANSDGVWNESGASVSFVLEPHFYQTSWFIGFAAVLFLTSGPSFYFYRMKNLKRRKAELEHLVQDRTGELQKTLNNLKDTQTQLILSEKMASLGQLTAGIAHEIKNPLNFITNFAVLSKGLATDLRQELLAERERVDPKRAQEIGELLNDLEVNVGKIHDHGKRADSIVRGMLLHSRGKAGERQETDLNALLAEYANLAYHGMRAQDQSFNVKIETDLDPSIGMMKVVPQDLSRAFLNIVNNACYAANDKRKTAVNGFTPTVKVSARNIGDSVEIRIRDNGNGIPENIRKKVFNPFFTTKPAGVGTGLGLSLSYDIVTQVHKGEIRIDTKEGEFTEFVLVIPRNAVDDGGAHA